MAVFQRNLTGRLLLWSALSIAAGALLQVGRSPFWRAFGQQAAGWGAIDAAIALIGRRGLRAKLRKGYTAADAAQDARTLRRVLWFNAALDVLYVAGGGWLMRTRGRTDARARGHGAGIAVQGAFLLVFDVVHALLIGGVARKAR